MQRDPGRVALPDRADIGQLDDGLCADAFLCRRDRVDRFRCQQNRAGLVRAEDFIPAQREHLGFIDIRVLLEFVLPDHLAGQLLDIDAGIHFVLRALLIELVVFVVGLDRDRRGITGEESRGYFDSRDVDREKTEFSRSGAMLMGREIFEVKARRYLLENEIVRLPALEPKWFFRRDSGLRRDAILWSQREIAFQRDRVEFHLDAKLVRYRRDRDPLRNVFGRDFFRERLRELNDDAPAGDVIALGGNALDRKRFYDADDDLLPHRERRLRFPRRETGVDDQFPVARRQWFGGRNEENVLPKRMRLLPVRVEFFLGIEWAQVFAPDREIVIITLVTWEFAVVIFRIVAFRSEEHTSELQSRLHLV